MNGNIYLNIVATILAIAVITLGVFQINSNDLVRSNLELLSSQFVQLDERFDALEKQLTENRVTDYVPSQKNQNTKNTTRQDNIANLRFFDKNATDGGRIIVAIRSETKNLNYMVNNEALASSVWTYCYDSLAERDYEHPEIFEPQLAESWSISDDKMVYTIKLKKGVLWHDFKDPVTGKEWKGVEVTSEDFKFYVDVIKNETTNCAPARGYLKDLESIEVISKYEFKVRWSKRYFLSESITLGLTPLPKHFYHSYKGPFDGKRFNDDHIRNGIVIGCGPYRFDRWVKGHKIVLKRWEKYYGREYGIMPSLKRVELEVIKHPNTQLQALVAGKIDQMSFSADQWVRRTNTPDFGEDGKIRKFKYLSRGYSYIGWNLKKELFKDKNIRRALTHLINRKKILKDVYHDLGVIVTGNFYIESAYYDKTIAPYIFSIDKAKQLLAQAGWNDSDDDGILDRDGKKFQFTVMGVSSSMEQKKMLAIIKEDMARAGIDMRIQMIEWSVYVKRLEEKNFEVCVLGWSMGFESDPNQIWHSQYADKNNTSNHIGFKNAEADRLIEAIRVTFDIKKRIELCHRFHRLIHEEQPYTFLFTRYSLVGQNRRYKNARVFPSGIQEKILWVPKQEQKNISIE